MARGTKENLFVLLDVGPSMRPHLRCAAEAVFNLVNSKIVFRPAHEVSVIAFGTTGTANALHDELVAEGDDTQYQNITEIRPLRVPDVGFLSAVSDLTVSSGVSDFLDALIVGLDLLIKAVASDPKREKAVKKIVLLSNFVAGVKPLPDAFRGPMVQKLQQNAVRLQVVSMDFDCPFGAGKEANLHIVKDLLKETAGELVGATSAYDVLRMFGSKETMPYLAYNGPVRIGDMMEIGVRLYKKTTQERLPSLKLYSDRLKDPNADHQVKREVEYKTLADPDHPVPPEERVKAYKYGKQKVPLSKEEEESLAYVPEKGISLLGFASKSQAPRHEYMKESYMVVPQAVGGSCEALSALCRALHAEQRVMIVRACLRARSAVFLGVMTPVLGSPTQPDALCMNVLPFKEDVRFYAFSSFDSRPEFSPSQKQLEAAQKVIDSMDLTAGGREQLRPESTPHPILRRFNHLLAARAVNPDAQPTDPGADALACHTLDPMYDSMPGCREALRDAEARFVTISSESQSKAPGAKEEAAVEPSRFGKLADAPIFDPDSAVRSSVSEVGTITPIEDFREMLAKGRVEDAFDGMRAAVRTLIESSFFSRLYDKALKCLGALREAAVMRRRAPEFNGFLKRLCDECKGDAQRGAAWATVVAAGVSLISNDEAAGAGVTRAEAADFMRQGAPSAEGPGEAMDTREEDEFEGME